MATEGVKISEMTELAEIKGTEYIPIVDGSENKKVKTDKIQSKLVSGTNIKTINGQSILGNGNIEINSNFNELSANEYVMELYSDDTLIATITNGAKSIEIEGDSYYDANMIGEFDNI